MGPAPFVIAATGIVGGAILSQQDDHTQVVNRFIRSYNIGGQLTNISTISIANFNGQVALAQFDEFLRRNSVPQETIRKAQKLKITQVGKIQSVSFIIEGADFRARLVVIKSTGLAQGKLIISLKVDDFKADYVTPLIQNDYTQGPQYAVRGFTPEQSSAITSALQTKVNQVKLTYQTS